MDARSKRLRVHKSEGSNPAGYPQKRGVICARVDTHCLAVDPRKALSPITRSQADLLITAHRLLRRSSGKEGKLVARPTSTRCPTTYPTRRRPTVRPVCRMRRRQSHCSAAVTLLRASRRHRRLLAQISNLYMGYPNWISLSRSSVRDSFRVHRHVRDARTQRTDPPRNTIRQK